MPHKLLAILLIGCCCSCTTAKEAEEPKTPGLEKAAKAPEFKLSDQNDKKVELAELLKKGTVAIVFHRSAEW